VRGAKDSVKLSWNGAKNRSRTNVFDLAQILRGARLYFMAGPSGQGTLKGKWSGETIRRRGVHAMVAALRLRKEQQGLLLELAVTREKSRLLQLALKRIRARQETLRKRMQRVDGAGTFTEKTGNSSSHQGKFDK